ncbi:histone deacetylase family protein [Rubrimonas cliftonensis]|uniref:Acetoin utilization deacetylase AcuC n=1 Tax=Rubrimonas cliftonensis TaxID=89524 RepID=A0A1H3VX10_9RHOB|nr:histone deacetylase [Rubrimonas cliftonensis]SDZ79353.1 Acetoin utilization deacetylase AcuC [Rubrimonas cliftonensis]
MALPIVHHPDYVAPLKPGHSFPMSKYGYLRQALERRGLMKPGGWLAPAAASPAMLGLAHCHDYVERAIGLRLTPDESRRIGLPQTEQVVRRARLAAAGAALAGRLALERGVACNGAGGSHHAARDFGAGFCVFNDVAVAAATLLAEGRVGRVLVIDADVHQGDGTARIFAGDARVFTLSIHAEKNFPARKAASSLDTGLADGLGDAAYLEALAAALETAFAAGPFDLAFYNAGVDVHAEDRLGRLKLSDAGLRARDRMALGAARDRATPVVGVLGGGYGDDPAVIAERHAVLFEEAARLAE